MSLATDIYDYVKANSEEDPDVGPATHKLPGVGTYMSSPSSVSVKTPDGAEWVSYFRATDDPESPWQEDVSLKKEPGTTYIYKDETRTVPDWKTPIGA